MKREVKRNLCGALALIVAFVLWTCILCIADVAPIGPEGSVVGLSTMNGSFHALTGVNMALYTVTDWLGLVPIAVAFGFAVLGLVQWIKRKRILRVDRSILVLGGFYAAVMAVYALFEVIAVNYRPVLIQGYLEASYPSSTTMLVMCVMPTAMMQCKARVRGRVLRVVLLWGMGAFLAFMVVGRVLSGVHWITDIVGGALISAGLVLGYRAAEQAL